MMSGIKAAFDKAFGKKNKPKKKVKSNASGVATVGKNKPKTTNNVRPGQGRSGSANKAKTGSLPKSTKSFKPAPIAEREKKTIQELAGKHRQVKKMEQAGKLPQGQTYKTPFEARKSVAGPTKENAAKMKTEQERKRIEWRSERSDELARKKADSNMQGKKLKYGYDSKKLASSIFNDTVKHIRKKNPNMSEGDILKYMTTLNDYGEDFGKYAKNELESYNKLKKAENAPKIGNVKSEKMRQDIRRRRDEQIAKNSVEEEIRAVKDRHMGYSDDDAIEEIAKSDLTGKDDVWVNALYARYKASSEGTRDIDRSNTKYWTDGMAERQAATDWEKRVQAAGGSWSGAYETLLADAKNADAGKYLDALKKVAKNDPRYQTEKNILLERSKTEKVSTGSIAQNRSRRGYSVNGIYGNTESGKRLARMEYARGEMDAQTASTNPLTKAYQAAAGAATSQVGSYINVLENLAENHKTYVVKNQDGTYTRYTDGKPAYTLAQDDRGFNNLKLEWERRQGSLGRSLMAEGQQETKAAQSGAGTLGKAALDVEAGVVQQVFNLPAYALGPYSKIGTQVLSMANFGMSSAGQAAWQAELAGANDREKLTAALGNGSAEAAFSMIPAGNFAKILQKGGKGTVEKWVRNIASQFLSEGKEEALTEIAQTVINELTYEHNLENMSLGEFIWQTTKDAAYSGLIGGLTGAGMGAAGTAAAVRNSRGKNILDAMIANAEQREALMEQNAYIGQDKSSGLREYKSDFDASVPMSERQKVFKDRVATIFNLGAVQLTADGKKIQVLGDRITAKKNLYGSKSGLHDVKINALYDLADILATSKFANKHIEKSFLPDNIQGPKTEPKNPAHKDVQQWYTFKNSIIFDGQPVDVVFDIRDKGNKQYQYEIKFKQKKPQLGNHTFTNMQTPASYSKLGYIDTDKPTNQQINAKHQNATVSIGKNMIAQKESAVNNNIRQNEEIDTKSGKDGVKEENSFDGTVELMDASGKAEDIAAGIIEGKFATDEAIEKVCADPKASDMLLEHGIDVRGGGVQARVAVKEYALGVPRQVKESDLNGTPEQNAAADGAVSLMQLSTKQLKIYKTYSSLANAIGGRIIVRNDMKPGNPGRILKYPDGTFDILLSDESLHDYVTAAHELTHAMEGTIYYDKFYKFVSEYLKENKVSEAEVKAEIAEEYAKMGDNLDETGVNHEMMAMFASKHLFDDKKTMTRMADADPDLATWVLEWVKDRINILKAADADAAFYIKARRKLVQAYRASRNAMFWEGSRWDDDRASQNLFVGVDQVTAKLAEEMEAEGKNRQEIWEELGVNRTMDGKSWRREIDDSKMEYFPKGNAKTVDRAQEGQAKKTVGLLDDFVKYDELFREYPDMKNTDLKFDDSEGTAYFEPSTDTVGINNKDVEAQKSSLVHEIQHAIQNKENWAFGFDSSSWESSMKKKLVKQIKDILAGLNEEQKAKFDRHQGKLKKYLDEKDSDAEGSKSLLAEVKKLRAELAKEEWAQEIFDINAMIRNLPNVSREMYWNSAGEIEARNAQERRKMTAEERRKKLPQQADEKTIFAYDGVNNKQQNALNGTDDFDIDNIISRNKEGEDWNEVTKRWELAKEKVDLSEAAEAVERKPQNDSIVGKVKNAIPEMQNEKSVANLTGNEFAKGEKKLTEQVGEFFRSIGNKVHRKGMGEVILNERSVLSDIAHGLGRSKAVTFAAVPEVIKYGKEIEVNTNWKGRGKTSHLIVAPVDIAGQRGYVGVVVLSDVDNRFYLHEVVDSDGNIIYIKNKKSTVSNPELPRFKAGITGKSTSYKNSIPQKAENIKLHTLMGVDTPAGEKVAKAWEEKITKKKQRIWHSDRLTLFESLKSEREKAHGKLNEKEREALWRQFTTYLDDLQEANGLQRNAPRPRNLPRQENGAPTDIYEKQMLDNLIKDSQPDSGDILTRFKDKAVSAGHRLYADLVDSQNVVEQFSKAEKNFKGEKEATTSERLNAVRNASGTVDYIFGGKLVDRDGNELKFTDHNGNRVCKGFAELFMKDGKTLSNSEMDALNQYMQHANNMDCLRNGRLYMDSDEAASGKYLRSTETYYPWVKGMAEDIRNWYNTFMEEWAVGSGLMDKWSFDYLRQYNPNYVPGLRVDKQGMKKETQKMGKGEEYHIGAATKKAEGSIKEIVPIQESFMIMVDSLVKRARKNEMVLGMFDSAGKHPELFATYLNVTDYKAEQAISDYDGWYNGLTEYQRINAEEVKSGGNKITCFKDGYVWQGEASAEVIQALNLLGDNGDHHAILEVVKKVFTNPMKTLTTGVNPAFALANIMRDTQDYFLYSKANGFRALQNYVAAAYDMLRKSDIYKEYQAQGGKNAGRYHQHKGNVGAKKDVRKANSKASAMKALVSLMEGLETLPRMAEYRNVIQERGESTKNGAQRSAGVKKQASAAAADVTINFARHGKTTKMFDTFTLYLNASVQGIDKYCREIRRNPVKVLTRSAVLHSLPTVLLWALWHCVWDDDGEDNEYDKLSNRTKDTNYIIPNVFKDKDENGKYTEFIKIPKTRESSLVFSMLIERGVRLMSGDEDAFKGVGYTLSTNLPANPLVDNAFASIIQVKTNRDYAGRSIVPESMADLSPVNQWDINTSKAAIAIGKMLSKTPLKNSLLASPKNIDYLIGQSTGILGDVLQNATSLQNSSWQEGALRVLTQPFTDKFTASSAKNSQVLADFYDDYDKVKRQAEDSKFEIGSEADLKLPISRVDSYYYRVSAEISQIYKWEKDMLAASDISAKQKKEYSKLFRMRINELAGSVDYKQAMAAAENLTNLTGRRMKEMEGSELWQSMGKDARAAAKAQVYQAAYGEYVAAGGTQLSSDSETDSAKKLWSAYDGQSKSGHGYAEYMGTKGIIKASGSQVDVEKVLAMQDKGVKLNTCIDYLTRTADLHSDKGADGKSISGMVPGGKMWKVAQVIAQMDISDSEKDVLFKQYSKTSYKQLGKTPWHSGKAVSFKAAEVVKPQGSKNLDWIEVIRSLGSRG